MADNTKKNNRPRRPQEQSQGAEAPRIGKISGPRRPQQGGRGRQKPAQKAAAPKQEPNRKTAPKNNEGRGKGKRPSTGTAPIAAAQQKAMQAPQPPKRQNSRGRGRRSHKPAIRAYFLGGLNEIGKNFTLYECQDDMFIVDCGFFLQR